MRRYMVLFILSLIDGVPNGRSSNLRGRLPPFDSPDVVKSAFFRRTLANGEAQTRSATDPRRVADVQGSSAR
jgi:hypothetical protein